MEQDRERDRLKSASVHILDEDDHSVLISLRVSKAWLVANIDFITAIYELTNLLVDDE